MRKVAIVGADAFGWSKNQILEARITIARIYTQEILKATGLLDQRFLSKEDYNSITLVSGHCHKGGIDIWAEELAKEFGIPIEPHPAQAKQWADRKVEVLAQLWGSKKPTMTRVLKGYRSRNIDIAKSCDVLYDIEPKGKCTNCRGTGTRAIGVLGDELVCMKCDGDGAYSGGTWTMKYANKLGKPTKKLIIS